jgi:hypothetical protein
MVHQFPIKTPTKCAPPSRRVRVKEHKTEGRNGGKKETKG